ncbi:hypothetical protein [Nocardia alba]|uniref:Uncharacterized protein n=1 Tax=Nocardia alba TaxID=225051 RepID=A0A4R1FS95_9NOCA|nr:hypothetical protein [Nocardia alba]TCJ97713.1 hypothetical protein DFR71_3761 [Nocardia alba]
MSGRKQIYVEETEWNRLQAQARDLAQVNRDLPGLLTRIQEQTEQSAQRAVAEMSRRQAGFESAVADLSEHVRMSEQRSDQRLRASTHEIMTRLRDQGATLRAENATALRAQREVFERALADERTERQAQFAAIDTRVAGLQTDSARAAELTVTYLADARILRDQAADYPHERLCPGRLAGLDAERADLIGTLNGGVAAGFLLGPARALTRQLSELRSELAILDAQWRSYRLAAEGGLVRLRELIRGNATIDSAATFGVDTAEAPDVDHWSNGMLAHLDTEVAELLTRVRDDAEPMSTEALQALVENVIPGLDRRLDDTVEAAVVAVRASQLRANLAELIAEALDDEHQYQVLGAEDTGYVEADQRRAFLARTVNQVTGGEVIIEIIPHDDIARAPVVEIHSFDGEAAEEERQARITSIHDSVHDRTGIDLRSTTVAAVPDRTRRDVANLVKTPGTKSLG